MSPVCEGTGSATAPMQVSNTCEFTNQHPPSPKILGRSLRRRRYARTFECRNAVIAKKQEGH